MGRKLNRWMVLTHLHRTLSMPRGTCEENKKWTNLRHGLVQAQVYYPTKRNTSGSNCQSNQQFNMCIKRQKENWGFRTDGSITKTRRATYQESNPRRRTKSNFEPSVKPPAPIPRVEITKPANEPRIQVNKKRMSVSDANIEKAIQNASNKRIVRVPLARVLARRQ